VTSLLSVIMPVRPGAGDPLAACAAVKQALSPSGTALEFVVVLDGTSPDLERRLIKAKSAGEKLRVVRLTRASGESAAILAGLGFATGEWILTYPAAQEIDPAGLPALVKALDENDLAIAVRRQPRGFFLSRLRRGFYGALATSLLGIRVSDLSCPVRAGRRAVFGEIPLHGGDHRFLPVLAHRLGFRVAAIEVRGSEAGGLGAAAAGGGGVPSQRGGELSGRPGGGALGLLDLQALFFLTRFSREPLRFFGFLGGPIFGAALITFGYLLFIKLVFHRPLANRPLLLLAVLLLVLGVQIIALGLVAEIIVFAHLRDVEEYSAEEVAG
jgi:glycosyltransferase involved in cell wall biosynthesis